MRVIESHCVLALSRKTNFESIDVRRYVLSAQAVEMMLVKAAFIFPARDANALEDPQELQSYFSLTIGAKGNAIESQAAGPRLPSQFSAMPSNA